MQVNTNGEAKKNGQVEKADTVGRGRGRGHGHGHEPKLIIFSALCSVEQKLNMVIHWLKLLA